MPLQGREIDEIKPLVSEKIMSNESEKQKLKTPEKEVEEFIERFEILEDKEGEKQEGKIKPKEKLDETQILLKDYEQTYESELPEQRKKKIEEFAKNVAHEIIHPKGDKFEETKNVIETDESNEFKIDDSEFKINDPNVELRGKLTKEEQDEVKRVMFGGKKKDENS